MRRLLLVCALLAACLISVAGCGSPAGHTRHTVSQAAQSPPTPCAAWRRSADTDVRRAEHYVRLAKSEPKDSEMALGYYSLTTFELGRAEHLARQMWTDGCAQSVNRFRG